MYWNRKLDSLLPSILIAQNERNSAEAVILPARPCITRTKLAEQPVIFVMWGHFSALTLRTLAGSPNSAVSSCSSHLPVLSHLKSKLGTYRGLFLSKDGTTCKNKSLFLWLGTQGEAQRLSLAHGKADSSPNARTGGGTLGDSQSPRG